MFDTHAPDEAVGAQSTPERLSDECVTESASVTSVAASKSDAFPISESGSSAGSLVPACRTFNQRMRAHGEPPFLLPEDASANEGAATHGGVCRNHYVAVDERGAVRGGVPLMEQRGWLGSAVIPLINILAP
jgi:hypothetical protein